MQLLPLYLALVHFDLQNVRFKAVFIHDWAFVKVGHTPHRRHRRPCAAWPSCMYCASRTPHVAGGLREGRPLTGGLWRV